MNRNMLWGAALLSLLAASCSNEDIIENGTEVVTGKIITLNAVINNGADTRVTYDDDGHNIKVSWSGDEHFSLYRVDNFTTGSIFSNTTSATNMFSGNDLAGIGCYYGVYGDNIKRINNTLAIDLSGAQLGTSAKDGIKEFMFAGVSELTNKFIFNHMLTVLKLNLKFPVEATGKVSKVTISGLHNKATYILKDASYAYADDNKGDITATNGKTGFAIDASTHKITAYVAVFPESFTANQVTIKAIVGTNEYYYTLTNTSQLQKGRVMPVNVTLTRKNFKSEYTREDYKMWSYENCGSAATADQMEMYLGAGVYWDQGVAGENQQTYKLPDGKTYHKGLWVMRKAYIGPGVYPCVYANEEIGTYKNGRPGPSEIYKYFFMPAAGCYEANGNFNYKAGVWCRCWSSTEIGPGVNSIFCLYYSWNAYQYTTVAAVVENKDFDYAYMLPMFAE